MVNHQIEHRGLVLNIGRSIEILRRAGLDSSAAALESRLQALAPPAPRRSPNSISAAELVQVARDRGAPFGDRVCARVELLAIENRALRERLAALEGDLSGRFARFEARLDALESDH
jgi:hypothetical protein